MGDAVGREKERGEGVLRDQRKKQWVVGLPRESAVQKIDRWERKVTVNCKLSIAHRSMVSRRCWLRLSEDKFAAQRIYRSSFFILF